MESLVNGAFLFQLPMDLTTKENLRLTVELNPHRFPLEPDYADNSLTAGPFDFKPSPWFGVQFYGLGYTLKGDTQYPRHIDVDLTTSWLRRAYPLATASGPPGDPSPGLHTSKHYVNLGSEFALLVNGSHPICKFLFPPKDRTSAPVSLPSAS